MPAAASILITRPMWRTRHLTNEAIQGIALVILIAVLSGTLLMLFFQDYTVIGGVSILLSPFNLFLYQHYTRWLNTSRCPWCHTRSLRIRKHNKGFYKLYCHHCGLHSHWHSWRYTPEEW